MKVRGLKGDEDDDETGEKLDNTNDDNDADFDNDYKARYLGYEDSDDGPAFGFGYAASVADIHTLTGIVENYYAAAAANAGAVACSLMAPRFAATVAGIYGSGAGPGYMRGSTCANVVSLLFAHDHLELVGKVVITGVRVAANEALVFIRSATMPAQFVMLERQHGRWGVVGLLGTALP